VIIISINQPFGNYYFE